MEVRVGQAGKWRAQGRPMGAATFGGKGFKERVRVSGERPIGATSCRQQYTQATCQPSLQQQRCFQPKHSISGPFWAIFTVFFKS